MGSIEVMNAASAVVADESFDALSAAEALAALAELETVQRRISSASLVLISRGGWPGLPNGIGRQLLS